MNWRDRIIIIAPEILVGKPVVKGTRLAMDFIVGLLAEGWSEGEIQACLSYAADILRAEKVYPCQRVPGFH